MRQHKKHFGRVKIGRKLFRESLKKDVFTTAKLLLGDFIKKKRRHAERPVAGTFGEARVLYEADVDADHTLKDGSKLYQHTTIKTLFHTWPDLDKQAQAKITETDCRAWAARLAQKCGAKFFNYTLSTLRHILERAGIGRDDNPAFKGKRLGVKQRELKLPEPKRFEELLRLIETSRARQSKDCANVVRFLAFSGRRLSEARHLGRRGF